MLLLFVGIFKDALCVTMTIGVRAMLEFLRILVYCAVLYIVISRPELKNPHVSGIKGSVCLYAADRRVSVTPWLGEPPCDPNPSARPKAFSKYSFDLDILSPRREAVPCLLGKQRYRSCGGGGGLGV